MPRASAWSTSGVYAIEKYGLEKAPRGSSGYDALTTEGKTVQIKTNKAADMIGWRGEADLLLAISINNDGTWSELYYGDFFSVLEVANYSKRDNKHTVTISKLKALAKAK